MLLRSPIMRCGHFLAFLEIHKEAVAKVFYCGDIRGALASSMAEMLREVIVDQCGSSSAAGPPRHLASLGASSYT
jgi:hypothetical protein